jgi:hypothetical protein
MFSKYVHQIGFLFTYSSFRLTKSHVFDSLPSAKPHQTITRPENF